jgi:hypothetical protein
MSAPVCILKSSVGEEVKGSTNDKSFISFHSVYMTFCVYTFSMGATSIELLLNEGS